MSKIGKKQDLGNKKREGEKKHTRRKGRTLPFVGSTLRKRERKEKRRIGDRAEHSSEGC